MEPHQEAKLDKILIGLSRLEPQVADTKRAVEKLDNDVNHINIVNTQQSERIAANANHLDNLGKKMRDHTGQVSIHQPIPAAPVEDPFSGATTRWRFVGAVSAGVLGILGILTAIVHFLPGGTP